MCAGGGSVIRTDLSDSTAVRAEMDKIKLGDFFAFNYFFVQKAGKMELIINIGTIKIEGIANLVKYRKKNK